MNKYTDLFKLNMTEEQLSYTFVSMLKADQSEKERKELEEAYAEAVEIKLKGVKTQG